MQCSSTSSKIENCKKEISSHNKKIYRVCSCHGYTWADGIHLEGARGWFSEEKESNYFKVTSYEKGSFKGHCCEYVTIYGVNLSSGENVEINKDDFILDRSYGPKRRYYDECGKNNYPNLWIYIIILAGLISSKNIAALFTEE